MVSWSFEFMPPRGTDTIDGIVSNVSAINPSFCSVTWKPGGVSRDVSIEMACKLPNGVMHITATKMIYADILEILNECKERGVSSILVLRGDPLPNDATPFHNALDLVQFIRVHFGSIFRIGVAGYPEGFPPYSYEESLQYLKKKVEAGADFIITQLFFDAQVFLRFKMDCNAIGITCPIYPGVMPITSYNNLVHISKTCHIQIPESFIKFAEQYKDIPKNVATYGRGFCASLCQDLIGLGEKHIHVYTMNKLQNTIDMIHSLQVP